jgi:hypothetical protein
MADTKISNMTAASTLTGAELLAGVQSAENVKVTADQIKAWALRGTTTNDSAATGAIGQVIESTVLVGAAVSLSNGASKTVTSISLTAGDWDVWGVVGFSPNGATTVSGIQGAVNTTTDTLPTAPGDGAIAALFATLTTGFAQYLPVGSRRVSISATTTIYLIANSSFLVNTMAAFGYIGARRRR